MFLVLVVTWLIALGLPASSSAQLISYEYDLMGRITLMRSSEGITQWTYDPAGNILSILTRRFSDVPGPVALLLVRPTGGFPGTQVNLYGRGFGPTPAQNQVAFSGTPASIVSASPDLLMVSVPEGAVSGFITVTAPTGTATSPDRFLVGPRVTPTMAALFPRQSLTFVSTEPAQWSAGGLVGGGLAVGTITRTGTTATYQAPSSVPPTGLVNIGAANQADLTLKANATVEILAPTDRLRGQPVSVALAPAIFLPSTALALAPGGSSPVPIRLSAPAPSGGLTVTLVSSAPVTATVTPSVLIPAGATGGTATVTALGPGVALITASAAGFASATMVVTVEVAGVITTIAGTGTPGFGGDGGPAVNAGLNFPTGVAVDRNGDLYIADQGNHRVRKVGAATGLITTVAGTGTPGFGGDGGPATSAQLNLPSGIALGRDGRDNLFLLIADRDNHRIRRVDAVTGTITTVAGDGTPGFGGDGGPAANAQLRFPTGVGLNTRSGFTPFTAFSTIYIADFSNRRIRKIDGATGIITPVAGTGMPGFGGDGGPATSASLDLPFGLAVVQSCGNCDDNENLFIADQFNHRIRLVENLTGTITTAAGSGPTGITAGGFGGDGGPATSAQLRFPLGVALDPSLNLFIADADNHRIRRIDGRTGTILTVAGDGPAGFGLGGYAGDGGLATSARLNAPFGLGFDRDGNLYIADTSNHVIRQVTRGTGLLLPGSTFVPRGVAEPVAVGLWDPAPAGSVTVTLVSGAPATATVTPSVVIPAGATATPATLTGVASGLTTITASAAGFPSRTMTVTVGVSLALPGALSVTRGAGRDFDVTLSEPAPAGGVAVTLVSGSPATATVTPAVVIPAGVTATPATVTGVAARLTTVTASAAGVQGATMLVIVNEPGTLLLPASLAVAQGASQDFPVSLSAPAPSGGVTVTLTSSDSNVATVTPAVLIPAGGTSVTATVTGVAAGLATITASAPGFQSGTMLVTVTARPNILLPASLLVTRGLSQPFPVTLSDLAPPGGLTVTLVSSDPATATVAPASLLIPAGATSGTASVTGVAAGLANITASAPGLQSGTMSVTVRVVTLSFSPAAGSFLPGPAVGFRTRLVMDAPAPSGGQGVTLTSSDPAVATAPDAVTIPAGQTSVEVTIIGTGLGTATITPSAPGLTTAGVFTGTVVDVGLTLPASLQTGTGVRTGAAVTLPGPASTAVDVTLTGSHPAFARLAPANTTGAPSPSITLTIPAGETAANFDVLGVAPAELPAFFFPHGLARDAAGHLFIVDLFTHRIQRLDAVTGILSTVAGTGTPSSTGDGGPAAAATLFFPAALAFDPAGNLAISELFGSRIRLIVPGADGLITGAADETISTLVPPGAANGPLQLLFDAAGHLFWSDSGTGEVRRRQAGTGVVTTVGGGFSPFNGPRGLAFDRAGHLLVVDTGNNQIRRIEAGTGAVTTVAGTGAADSTGDGGPATAGTFNQPDDLVFDPAGTLYVTERAGVRLRKIDPGADGLITGAPDETIGTVTTALSGSALLLREPAGTLLVSGGNFSSDIQRVDPATGAVSQVVPTGVQVRATAPGFAEATALVAIPRSSFVVLPATTTLNLGVPSTYRVRVDAPNACTGCRVAQDTPITVVPSDPSVLSPETPATIPNNGTTTGDRTLTPAGPGQATLMASTAPSIPINPGTSATITVLP